MDIILYNGQIHTMNDTMQICQGLAINQKKIHSLGTSEDVLALKTAHTQMIDLKGRILMPGFNDSHMHLLGYGMALCQVDLSTARSIQEMIEMTQAFIKDQKIKPGQWVMGRGWNQDLFTDNRLPTYADLSLISSDHPIVLRRVCGHVAVVNATAIDQLNLSYGPGLVEGGTFDKGIFKENAMDLIFDKMPAPKQEDLEDYIQRAITKLHSLGITSVQSDDLCVFPKELSPLIMKTFQDMALQGRLKMNVYEQALFRDIDNFKYFLDQGYTVNKSMGNFKLGPLKILGDGALGGRTAWLSQGYVDGEGSGIAMYSQEYLNAYVALAQANGVPVAIHCIGDAMLDSALEAIEKAQATYKNPHLRHGIVHCQITRPSQLKRMAQAHVFAYIQPIFLDYDLHILEDRVGKTLADTSYAWHTMTDLGIAIPMGSDAPVETPDPLKGAFCAIHRQTLQAWPEKGHVAKERLSPDQVFKHYSRTPAWASYDEDHRGQIKPGYDADLVVLSKTHLEDLLNTRVDYTISHGLVVYKQENPHIHEG